MDLIHGFYLNQGTYFGTTGRDLQGSDRLYSNMGGEKFPQCSSIGLMYNEAITFVYKMKLFPTTYAL